MSDSKIKLEVGKRYVRRDGGITAPLSGNGSRTWPFRDGEVIYTYDGHYRDYLDPSTHDLVSEYVEQPLAPSEPEQPQKTLRDEFAMVALPAIIQTGWLSEPGVSPEYTAALLAYRVADAMLEAREERS